MTFPDAPERPEDLPPGWPAWFAPAGFAAAFLVVSVLVPVLALITGASLEDSPPEFTLAATVIQDAGLIAAALLLARIRARPRLWHFGLRRVALWPAVGWTAVAVASFYLFAGAYSALAQPDGEQTIVKDLGANESTALLIASAVLVVGIAPVVEELFFRAFFYGALRTRFGVWSAASMNAVVFGAIHYSGPDTLSILPPLAFLGFCFCLLYERTGSIYPVIAFHAINNMIALSVATGSDGAPVALAVGALVLAGCVAIPARQRPGAPRPLRP